MWVTTAWGTLLKGSSLREVENHCAKSLVKPTDELEIQLCGEDLQGMPGSPIVLQPHRMGVNSMREIASRAWA